MKRNVCSWIANNPKCLQNSTNGIVYGVNVVISDLKPEYVYIHITG